MNHQYDAAAVDLDAAEAAAGRTRSPAPNRSLMHMIRAVHAAGRGDLQATVDHAEAAVTLTPDFYSRSLAEAHLVFGCLLLGRRDAALEVVASGAPAPRSLLCSASVPAMRRAGGAMPESVEMPVPVSTVTRAPRPPTRRRSAAGRSAQRASASASR